MPTSEQLSGVCAVVRCGDKSLLLAHTTVGLDRDEDGLITDDGDFRTVRIRDTLRGRDYIETLLHEWLHGRFDDLSEECVTQAAIQMVDMLFLPEVQQRGGR